MGSRRLGCISASGLLTALVTLLVIVGVGLAQGGVLFSPGELSQQNATQALGGVYSHAEIGGNCSACHVTPWSRQTMADRCLICHSNIMDAGQLHAPLLLDHQSACRKCHPEHRGPQAVLTLLDSRDFPHETVGYSLIGHQQMPDGQPFVCDDCHVLDIRSFDQAACESCHRDDQPEFIQIHTTDFGQDCLACHDGVDRYGSDFNHSSLSFPLSGKHSSLACARCHEGAQNSASLSGLPKECVACHLDVDPHAGQFGQDCAACHFTTDWQTADFDHTRSAFPLTGAHIRIECQDCHKNQIYAGTPTDCYSCHVGDDAHQTEFGQDCAACHSTDDWSNAVFDHSLASFQLTGAHLQVACSECHLQEAGAVIFKGTQQECQACHQDPEYHLGLFSSDCAACHTTWGWSPAIYEEAHTFPLNHGESGLSECRVCHPDRLQNYTCYDCHEHNPVEIENEHREEGITSFSDCTRCHPTGREEEAERSDDD